MAKVAMKRIELLAMLGESKSIVDLLQRRGVVEISDFEENPDLYKMSTSTTISQLEKYQDTAEQALDVLNRYTSAKGGGLLASLNGKTRLSFEEFIKRSEEADGILNKCFDICKYEKKISDDKASIVRANTAIDALSPWLSLDIPMQCSSTENTAVFIGALPKAYDRDMLAQDLATQIPEVDAIDIEIVSVLPNQTCVVVMCHKSDFDAVNSALRALGFVKPADPTKHPPMVRKERLEKEIFELEEDIEKSVDAIKTFDGERENIKFLIDYFEMRKEKYEALSKFGMSNNVFVLTGYVPEPCVEKLTKELEEKFTVAVNIFDPDYENEDVPVLLKNDDLFAGPVESITNMYAPPSNSDVDPNPIMSFFYYMLFGLMLGDAGYGILMVIAMLFAKAKFKNMEPAMKRTCNMWMWCGVGTTFWGLIFGGFFGDLIPTIYKNFIPGKAAPNLALWFNPMDDPMKLLAFSFIIGIIHLFTGLAIKFYMLCKEKKILDAIFDVVFIYMIVIGIVPFGAAFIGYTNLSNLTMPGLILAGVGAVGVVLTSGRESKSIGGKLGGGFYGLYNTASGYLGDILSYSRLLALAL
ncbi:MAG: V-type ATP synthase subunit I, partial [Clostridiales bacterium]|nr:V-type ATP synthase subunit I [Clostridiales bacterium]